MVGVPPIVEIIRVKREGGILSEAEIDAMVAGMVAGASDSQLAAFAMATLLRGMTASECAQLTSAMTSSGERLDWRELNLPGPVLDKHSTGGVGDKVSLLLAPMLAACGAFVPMISGRGLGHTGGTLDKLEAIPGYRTQLSLTEIQAVTREVGCVIVGATADIAPADARFYAVRDVTATVESVPLITSSILSKKMAAGIDALVMDVKVGHGAFTPGLAQATELANSLVNVADAAGLPTRALVTDMDQVLGRNAGNAVEVLETVHALRDGDGDERLLEVTCSLGAELLVMGGLAASLETAYQSLQRTISTGAACRFFDHMVVTLGGPTEFCARAEDLLPQAPERVPVPARRSGYVRQIAVRDLGLAVVNLGGGRQVPGDAVDHSVGLVDVAGHGTWVEAGAPLAVVHAANVGDARAAVEQVLRAITMGDEPPAPLVSIAKRITKEGS